jgi:hypothetical protein
MFTRLARPGLVKSGFAKLWPVQPRRVAPVSCQAGLPSYSNDNLPGFCPALASKRRSPAPALAFHWFDRDGRLECRWQVEPDGDAPIGGVNERGTKGRVTMPLSMSPRGGGLALAG